jgi:hypothetical protein
VLSLFKVTNCLSKRGWDCAVGIATRYGLQGPGIESRLGRDFPRPLKPALGPTQPLMQWVPGLSGGVKRSGRGVVHTPHLTPRLKKEYSYTSTHPRGLRGLCELYSNFNFLSNLGSKYFAFFGLLYVLYFTILILDLLFENKATFDSS